MAGFDPRVSGARSLLEHAPGGIPRRPRARPRDKDNRAIFLCPMGCRDYQRVNPVGYCRHLCGFTTNGKTMEYREAFAKVKPTKENPKPPLDEERTGNLVGPVQKEDFIVRMEGNSNRVYRRNWKGPIRELTEEMKAKFGITVKVTRPMEFDAEDDDEIPEYEDDSFPVDTEAAGYDELPPEPASVRGGPKGPNLATVAGGGKPEPVKIAGKKPE